MTRLEYAHDASSQQADADAAWLGEVYAAADPFGGDQ